MGAFSLVTPLSDKIIILVPASTAYTALSNMASKALSIPFTPSSNGNKIEIDVALKSE